MALLLSGERPTTAAARFHPFRALLALVAEVRAEKARRRGLDNLLELDTHRLADLGITRSDLFDAMQAEPHRRARLLNERRERNATDWLNP